MVTDIGGGHLRKIDGIDALSLCAGVIDLLMGLFRGAVFRLSGVPENSPH